MARIPNYPHNYSRNRCYPIYSTSLQGMMPLQYSCYSKRKGGQVRFTANQTDVLEKRFLLTSI
ncbi:hypothetical protein NQ314_004448 [Rhamnusium bicolor]|uniref:Uncharacterized protein n=1 Tax=Rhamnusium bicolor TaxID=1586634 RepID=A0AAV8ZJ39_9CUCU|nr:hypothetical protein NQ314_004448 [Rhamnusium bicolor]